MILLASRTKLVVSVNVEAQSVRVQNAEFLKDIQKDTPENTVKLTDVIDVVVEVL
jgi:hypothetical protein